MLGSFLPELSWSFSRNQSTQVEGADAVMQSFKLRCTRQYLRKRRIRPESRELVSYRKVTARLTVIQVYAENRPPEHCTPRFV